MLVLINQRVSKKVHTQGASRQAIASSNLPAILSVPLPNAIVSDPAFLPADARRFQPKEMQKLNVPVFALEREMYAENTERVRTRIQAFIEQVRNV